MNVNWTGAESVMRKGSDSNWFIGVLHIRSVVPGVARETRPQICLRAAGSATSAGRRP
jgi:hypothetical protein